MWNKSFFEFDIYYTLKFMFLYINPIYFQTAVRKISVRCDGVKSNKKMGNIRCDTPNFMLLCHDSFAVGTRYLS